MHLRLEGTALNGGRGKKWMGDGGRHVPLSIVHGLPLINKAITKTNLSLIFFQKLCNEDIDPWIELGNGFRTSFLIV